MSSLYNNIKELCDDKGVTVSQMCIATGVRTGKLSDLKYGRKQTITLPVAEKIASYFGVSLDRLIYGSEGNSESRPYDIFVEEIRDRPEMKMLFKTSRNATKEQIELVANLLETMIEKDKAK